MNLIFFLASFLLDPSLFQNVKTLPLQPCDEAVIATKRIEYPGFKSAHNPSIIKFKDKYLLSFRYLPNKKKPWISNIGVALLDKNFEPFSEPQILETRTATSKTPSQSEDSRFYSHNGMIFLIYNDNIEKVNPSVQERRDMFIAKLNYDESLGTFNLSTPLKIIHKGKYKSVLWQKNWVPFAYEDKLLFSYSIDPHEVLEENRNGICPVTCVTKGDIDWKWGKLRGSSAPQLVDGEYLGFFHSGKKFVSAVSKNKELWHYFMGAYTFSQAPPFHLTRISPSPIIGHNFYTESSCEKRVVYPGGFVLDEDVIYLAYGKDDGEMWIATFDKKKLMNSLIPVE